MLQIFIGAATNLKHNKKDQYMNYKACLLILQAHVISTQAQSEAFNGEDILGVKIIQFASIVHIHFK